MDRIAVLIPCYNEAETIARVVSDFRRALPEAVIYVYDNNSTDSTAALAAAAGAVVRREPRQGKGSVVRRMFREVDAKVYIMVDGDDTYAAQDAPEMVRLVLEEQAEMVVGDRLSSSYFTENKRPFHNFGNRLVCRCVRLLFHGGVINRRIISVFGDDFLFDQPVEPRLHRRISQLASPGEQFFVRLGDGHRTVVPEQLQ